MTEGASERRARCDRERAAALKHFANQRELYAVELAQLMGCTVPKAVSILRRLWLSGTLTRIKRPSPHSGQGRLYYRVRLLQ